MTKRTLQRKGYTIKQTSVGWWVDKPCGYAVTLGYWDTEAIAVGKASEAIAEALAEGRRPIWMF